MRERSNSLSSRSEIAPDPISALVAAFDCTVVVKSSLVTRGAWALRCSQPTGFKFFAVANGGGWISDGVAGPGQWLAAGDVILLNGQQTFILASDPDQAPTDAAQVFSNAIDGIARIGSSTGPDTTFVGGRIDFDPLDAAVISNLLPPLSLVPAGSTEAGSMRIMLDKLLSEVAGNRPGHSAASQQWARLILLEALRSAFEPDLGQRAGLLSALADPRMRKAVNRMHAEPGKLWTVELLAREVGMSRTSFATHFKSVAGIAPLEFLTNWRMQLARRLLLDEHQEIAAVAQAVGYGSESSFGAAYKRVTGVSPGRIQSGRDGGSATSPRRDPAAA